jgi:DNA polymerase sigma
MENEEILHKFEIGSCFFCDKILISELSTSEIIAYGDNLRQLFGDFTKLYGYKIGKKYVCESCKNDIWAIGQD